MNPWLRRGLWAAALGLAGWLLLESTEWVEETRPRPLPDALAALKPLLTDAGVLKIGHDLKFDTVALAQHGIAYRLISYYSPSQERHRQQRQQRQGQASGKAPPPH